MSPLLFGAGFLFFSGGVTYSDLKRLKEAKLTIGASSCGFFCWLAAPESNLKNLEERMC